MMKKLPLLILALILNGQLHSQSATLQLKGRVINQDRLPVEFANVMLMKNDSLLPEPAITDSLGRFTFRLAPGTYRLRIAQFGQELYTRSLVLPADTSLGDLLINESVLLESVTVTAKEQLIERKADRLVFHVGNSALASGGNALDALKATPMVRVQGDAVSIAGKGETLVMIDGRLLRLSADELAAFLKSIPADQVKSIEVITTPPASYDAEGNNGLLNIRLKTAKANSWNASAGAAYTQKIYAGGNAQLLFNSSYKKLSLQCSAATGSQKLQRSSDSRICFPGELWHMRTVSTSQDESLSLGLGAGYQFTERWSSGINYLGSFTGNTSASRPLTTRSVGDQGLPLGYVSSELNAGSKPQMGSWNWFNSLRLDSAGKTMTLNLDYFNYRKDDLLSFAASDLDPDRQALPSSFVSSLNSNVNRIGSYSGKADADIPLRRGFLSFGAKLAYTATDNDLQVFNRASGMDILDADQSNRFRYREYNEALYVSLNRKIGRKWEAQAGLRTEITQTEGYSENLDQTNRNRYAKLFPTAYLSYTPGNKHSFSISYSRRIRRPDFDYLNPFLIRSSPYYYALGNPFLKPSLTDNLELSHIHREKWVSSLSYSKVTGFAQSLSIPDAQTNITKTIPLNYADTYQAGISSYYHFDKWWWWESFTGFNAGYQYVRSRTELIASTGGCNAYVYSNNDFTLNRSKTVFLSVNYGWQLPGRYQIFGISAMHILDASLKVLLMNKSLSLTLTAQDLLNGQRPLISYVSNGIANTIQSYDDTRGFRIALNYKLGNASLKARQGEAGNEEEKRRLGN